jgi:hypothetical protein
MIDELHGLREWNAALRHRLQLALISGEFDELDAVTKEIASYHQVVADLLDGRRP